MWLSNWSLEREYQRTEGILSSIYSLQPVSAIVGLFALVSFILHCWQAYEILRDAKIGLPKRFSLRGSIPYLWLLTPLLITTDFHWMGTADDGAVTINVLKVGGDFSLFLILLWGGVIGLHQLLVQLTAQITLNKEVTD